MMALTQTPKFRASLERLVSNGPNVVRHLRSAGRYGLALQVKHDIENVEYFLKVAVDSEKTMLTQDEGGTDASRG